VLLTVSALLSGCLSQTNDGTQPVSVSVSVVADGQVLAQASGSFPAGTTALDALKPLIPLAYTDSPLGAFVTSVAGKPAPDDYYWALYVDDEYAKVGVSMLRLEKETRLEWRLEKIVDAQVS